MIYIYFQVTWLNFCYSILLLFVQLEEKTDDTYLYEDHTVVVPDQVLNIKRKR